LPGFRLPIFVAAALTACASAWALAVLPETRPAGAAVRAAPSYSAGIRYVRAQPLLWRLFLISFCGIAAFASMEAVFGLWTERNYGWSSREVGLAFVAVGGAGLTVQALLIGPLVARFGEARIILGGIVLLIFAIALPPVLRIPAASVVLMALLMAGHSLAFPNAGALVSRTTPPDAQGSVMGLNMASNALSRIVAPPFFGWLFAWHPDAPYVFCTLLIAMMIPVALQVIALRHSPTQ
jgi:predicted MFS family arabinose efflux permease